MDLTAANAQDAAAPQSAAPAGSTQLPALEVTAKKKAQAQKKAKPTPVKQAAEPIAPEPGPAPTPPANPNSTMSTSTPYAGGQVASGVTVGVLGDAGIFDTPFSATGYTHQTIQDQQSRTVGDVLANDPSVRNFYARGSGDDRSVIRGFGVYDQDIGFNGIFGFGSEGSFALEGIERVEVLKGPAAFLNGITQYGSIGGSINLIPKRASDIPLTEMTTTFLSTGQFGEAIDVGRRYGPNNEFGIRVNGAYADGDLPKDNSSSEIISGAVGLDYRGDRFRASLDAAHYDSGQNSTQLTGMTPSSNAFAFPSAPDGRTNFQQPWEFIDYQNDYGLAKAELDIAEKWTLFGAVGYGHADWASVFTGPALNNSNGDFSATPIAFSLESQTVVGEAGVRGIVETGPITHRLVFSWTGRDVVQRNGFAFDAGFTSNIYDPTYIDRPDFAPFPLRKSAELIPSSFQAADTLSILNDSVQLMVGIREQTITTKAFDRATGATAESATDSATSPSVGLVVKPLRNVSVYANYIEGLIPVTAPVGTINGGDILAPIKADQKEAGVKVDLGRLGVSAAIYEINQPFGLINASNSFSIQGDQRNRGLELTAFGEITTGLRVLGGVSFIDPKLVRTQNGADDGNEAVGVANTQLNIGLEWDTPLPGLTVNGRVIHTSSQFLDTANLQEIPDWTRTDIGLRYKYEAFGHEQTLRFTVENVFDESYWIGNIFGGVQLANPRTFLASHSIKF